MIYAHLRYSELTIFVTSSDCLLSDYFKSDKAQTLGLLEIFKKINRVIA